MYKTSLIVTVIVICSIRGFAQIEMTNAEVQEFYKQIKLTKEYKQLKERADSSNKAQPNAAAQQVDVTVIKKTDAALDENVFSADMDRSLIGMVLESYTLRYNKQTRKIVSIEKKHTRLQLN